jgi:hypothetical protein
MSTLDELEAIRARYEDAESDGRYDLSWHEDYGQAAHRDRATLLAHVDRLENLIRAMIENEPDDAALAELMHDMDARARAALAKDATT